MQNNAAPLTLQTATAKPPGGQAWVRFRCAAYTRGRGLHIGVLNETILPAVAKTLGVYCQGLSPVQQSHCEACDDKLDLYANGAFDYIFMGRIIEAIPHLHNLLIEATVKLRDGGHLMMQLPVGATVEGVIQHSFTLPRLRSMLEAVGYWQEKSAYERNGELLLIVKKLSNRSKRMLAPPPRPPKRVCVSRYGAIGDLVIISPLLRRLKEDGFHVTVNCNPYSAEVLKHSPHVDNLLVQERDAVPNHHLGPYWDEWRGDYDRYVNLSESIEGSLLQVEGRPTFYTTQDWRRTKGEHNYYTEMLRIGGYTDVASPCGELFFSPSEERQGAEWRKRCKDKFLVAWLPKGSSEHKSYPLMPEVLRGWLAKHPEALVFSIGGPDAQTWEFDHPQVIRTSGQWPLRLSLVSMKYADLVVGPETGMMNAAACFPQVRKIVFLSHSTHEALCKHWGPSHRCIAPTVACYPCFQLHYHIGSCPQMTVFDKDTNEELLNRPACTLGEDFAARALAALEDAHTAWQRGTIDLGGATSVKESVNAVCHAPNAQSA